MYLRVWMNIKKVWKLKVAIKMSKQFHDGKAEKKNRKSCDTLACKSVVFIYRQKGVTCII